MPENLTGDALYSTLASVIDTAADELLLVSPFVSLSDDIYGRISAAYRRGVSIVLAYSSTSPLSNHNLEKLSRMQGLQLFAIAHLHGRVYGNEKMLLVGSLNLNQSQHPSDVGMLVYRAEPEYEEVRTSMVGLIESKFGTVGRASLSSDSSLLAFSRVLRELLPEHQIEYAEAMRSVLLDMAMQVQKLNARLDITDAKLGFLSTVVDDTINDIVSIKKTGRSIDEKLSDIALRMAAVETEFISLAQAPEYTNRVQGWLAGWAKLEDASSLFLAVGECMYDVINSLDHQDFAPFVVEYCRALENEMSLKLFVPYVESYTGRLDNAQDRLRDDMRRPETRQFAEFLRRKDRAYTLGQMKWTMAQLREGGSTVAKSSVLQDFRDFTLGRFGPAVLTAQYSDQVGRIVDQYRNPAAHTTVLDKVTAANCRMAVRGAVSTWLESYRGD